MDKTNYHILKKLKNVGELYLRSLKKSCLNNKILREMPNLKGNLLNLSRDVLLI